MRAVRRAPGRLSVLLGAALLALATPTPAGASPVGDTGAGATQARPRVGVVDLNTATVEQLCTLPGVGPKKAEAIIELRKKRPFSRVTQLLEVKGIGKKTLERLKPHVQVSGGL